MDIKKHRRVHEIETVPCIRLLEFHKIAIKIEIVLQKIDNDQLIFLLEECQLNIFQHDFDYVGKLIALKNNNCRLPSIYITDQLRNSHARYGQVSIYSKYLTLLRNEYLKNSYYDNFELLDREGDALGFKMSNKGVFTIYCVTPNNIKNSVDLIIERCLSKF